MFGPILRGTLATLRPPEAQDWANFPKWFADLDVTLYLGRRTPPSAQQEEEFAKHLAEDRDGVFWIIEVDGKPVGGLGIHRIDWQNAHGTTGIVIGDKTYWRRGVASEAMALRTRFAFRELNLHKLKTEVCVENEASQRALQKSGYRQVGVRREERWSDGRWHDVWLGEVLRADWEREHTGEL